MRQSCLVLCLVAAGCGTESHPKALEDPSQGSGGQAGGVSMPAASAGQGGGGASNGAGAGAAMAGSSSRPRPMVSDAGVGIVYARPDVVVDPPVVGDTLVDEEGTEQALVFPPDAGLVDNAPGVAVGEEEPSGVGRASVCFHVDMIEGSFLMVPNNDSPNERLERVATFGLSEQGFELFAFFPWFVTFVDPEQAPYYLPTNQVTTVIAQRDEVSLLLRFQVQGNEIAMLSVEVLSL